MHLHNLKYKKSKRFWILLSNKSNSSNHSQFWAGELALEQPVAQVDGQIYLIMFSYVYDWFFVLHVYSHEFIANLWCMFCIVNHAELLVSNIILHLWVVLQLDAFTLDFLTPSVLVQTLSEKDDVGQNNLVVILIDPVAHSEEVKSKDFIHEHFLTIIISQQVVVSLPLRLALSCHFFLHVPWLDMSLH